MKKKEHRFEKGTKSSVQQMSPKQTGREYRKAIKLVRDVSFSSLTQMTWL